MHIEGGGPTTWEEGRQRIPLTHTAQLPTLQQYTTQTHITYNHFLKAVDQLMGIQL